MLARCPSMLTHFATFERTLVYVFSFQSFFALCKNRQVSCTPKDIKTNIMFFFLEQTVCVQAAWRPWAYVGTNQTRLAPPHIFHAFRHMLTKMSKHVLHCASNALRREVKHPLSNHQIPKPPLSSGWTQENTLTHTHTQIQSEDLTRPTMQRYTILKCHAKAWRSRP